MINERVLNIISAVTVLFMMAAICWRLADQFDPKYLYPSPGQRYTNTAYEKLEYQNAEYKHRWLNAEKAIRGLAE
jgi:hypothetical protein